MKKYLKQYGLKVIPTENDIEITKLKSSKDASNYIKKFFFDDVEIYESFFILMLDREHKTIAYAKISQGGTVGTVVDTKIICKYVIDTLAPAVIICHNHPSGNINPSEADISITKKIKEALKFIDSTLVDHIIITKNNHYSFVDNGLL